MPQGHRCRHNQQCKNNREKLKKKSAEISTHRNSMSGCRHNIFNQSIDYVYVLSIRILTSVASNNQQIQWYKPNQYIRLYLCNAHTIDSPQLLNIIMFICKTNKSKSYFARKFRSSLFCLILFSIWLSVCGRWLCLLWCIPAVVVEILCGLSAMCYMRAIFSL